MGYYDEQAHVYDRFDLGPPHPKAVHGEENDLAAEAYAARPELERVLALACGNRPPRLEHPQGLGRQYTASPGWTSAGP